MTVKKATKKSAVKAAKSDEFYPFSHAYIFRYVMENHNEIAREVIGTLLNKKVREVKCNKGEYDIKPNIESRGIRLDIYFEDDNNVYDVEMQVSSSETLGKRCRYYQSLLDTNIFKESQKFGKLKNSYIIFLCLFDPFNNEQCEQKSMQAINTFEMVRIDDPACKIEDALKLKTGAKVIICNTLAYEKTSENLHDLLEYIATQKVESDNSFVKKIDNVVQHANKNKDVRSAANMFDTKFMEAEEHGYEAGEEIGVKKGEERERQNTKKKLTRYLERNKDSLSKQAKEELETMIASLDTTELAAQH